MIDKKSKQRPLRTRTRVSTAIDSEIYEKFEEFANKSLIPKSKLFDIALELLLKEMSNR